MECAWRVERREDLPEELERSARLWKSDEKFRDKEILIRRDGKRETNGYAYSEGKRGFHSRRRKRRCELAIGTGTPMAGHRKVAVWLVVRHLVTGLSRFSSMRVILSLFGFRHMHVWCHRERRRPCTLCGYKKKEDLGAATIRYSWG